ncbi:Pentatricopeptide repeat [Macleaya cordata]|uniref:Pentatricopeptide repeat n=1 Tax=Macleaya cordata TaxID=56857 RepID=A0A200QYJ8_MACCD|nr:Pentatricopeptide repeat [Macleaya cordata]
MASINQTLLAFPSRQTPIPNNNHHHHHHHLFSALSSATTLPQLKQIHAQILRTGLDRSTSLLLKLIISSFSLSTSLDYALSVFNQISEPETRLCNQALREFSRSVEPEKTLLVYEKMRRDGVGVDRFSFPSLLKASARISALKEGMEIHGLASKMGFDLDPFVQTALIGVYAACGRIFESRQLFDKMLQRDVVTWSVMIDGYYQSELYEDALLTFEEMRSSGVEPDRMVLATIVSACSRTGNLNTGKAIHDYIIEKNVAMDPHLESTLISMYSNCGSMDLAQHLFDKLRPKNLVASTSMITGYSKLGKIEAARRIFYQMDEKDLVSWSAMIAGYAESDWPQEALKLFKEMQVSGLKPDQVTMLSVISACSQLGALDQAKWVHIFIKNHGFADVVSVNNALIDMYAKCGSLEEARRVFDKMPRRNVISWTSMITGFAMHGDADNALWFFDQMKAEKIEPNAVTFVGVLYACSHAGLVDDGRRIFSSMMNDYKIAPKQEHYGCMVDLFGRANLLREAVELIESMPFPPNVIVWGALLSACRVHSEVELGEFAAKRLLELDPDHDGAHVLLSNIYAKARRWGDVGEVRKFMKDQGIAKERGYSRIELNGVIHEFLMFDRTHKQVDEIYEKLDEVVSKLKLVGYAPNTGSVLVDLEEEEKKEVVLWHSEKLALCYGLLNLGKGSCIRIVKNLRVCEDCHTFIKLASKVFEREIVVRDRSRFHHYKDGICSCKDYW